MNQLFVSALVSLTITVGVASTAAAQTFMTANGPITTSHGKLFKGKVSANITRAESLLSQSKFEEAAEIFRSEISRNSKNIEAISGLGMALAMQFKLDGANEQFEKVLTEDPENPLAHVGKAMVTLNRLQSSNQTVIKNRDGLLSQAEADARFAIERDAQLPQAHYALGSILREQGKLADAYTEFKAATVADPQYGPAYSGQGLIDLTEGRLPEAVNNFRTAITLNSSNSTAHYGLGEALLKQGFTDEAIKELSTSLYQFRNSAPVHLALGKAYEAQGNTDAALKEYERAALIKPELKEAYTRMALLHTALGQQAEQAGNVVTALKEYRQAQLIEPQNSEPYLRMADLREHRGDLELAIAELRSGSEINPTDPQLHQRIGETLLKLDKFNDSIKEFRTVLQQQPGNSSTVDGLTRALYLKAQKESQGSFFLSNDFETAESTLKQAIQLRPNDMRLALALAKLNAMAGKPTDLSKIGNPTTDPERIAFAEALLAQNKFAEASQQMKDVISHTASPTDVLAVADLALMIKDLDSAEAAYKKAVSLGQPERANRGLAAVAKAREGSSKNYRLANDLLRRKQLASAVDNFREASFNNPRLPDARYGLAEAEQKLSPNSSVALRDAAVQYRAYLALAPNLPEKMRQKLTKRIDKIEVKASKIERKASIAGTGAANPAVH